MPAASAISRAVGRVWPGADELEHRVDDRVARALGPRRSTVDGLGARHRAAP